MFKYDVKKIEIYVLRNISDSKDNNKTERSASGITNNNACYELRYVIGVLLGVNQAIAEIIKLIGIAFSASFALGGIVMYYIRKNDRVSDLEVKFNRLTESIELGLENDSVIFKALRQGHINGESEAQKSKLNDFFFRKSIELLHEGGKHNEKH